MMLCPARQILTNEPDEQATAEALIFGTMVHWRIEQHMAGKLVDYDDMTRALAKAYMRDVPEGNINDVATNRQIRELLNEVQVAFEHWQEQVEKLLPDEDPIIEEKMTAQIWDDGEHVVELTGTPDAMYPKAKLIVDWKTAGKAWSKDKAQGQMQPWAYSLMAKHQGYPIERFEFWVYDRSTEAWWCHVHHLDDIEKGHAAIAVQAVSFAFQVEEGVPVFTPSGSGWKPRGWHCSPRYCDQWWRCPGKFLVADGQATQPALDPVSKGWSK